MCCDFAHGARAQNPQPESSHDLNIIVITAIDSTHQIEEEAEKALEKERVARQAARVEQERVRDMEALKARQGTSSRPQSLARPPPIYFKAAHFQPHELSEAKVGRFVVNPRWGINSLVPPDNQPRIVLQVRKFKHLELAPENPFAERDCVLVVMTDVSFLCCRERKKDLRLLIPPCSNARVVAGPSFSPGSYPFVFSLRFDDVGPLYLRCSSTDEARYWVRAFSEPPSYGAE